MIRWVFLDVGNVLFNDDPLTYLNHLRHFEAVERLRPGFEFAEFLAARERAIGAGERWPLYAWMRSILSAEQLAALWTEIAAEATRRFDELNPPLAEPRS